MEAVQNCEKLAYEYGNQQIDEQHLLYSLLTLEDSLILKLITKMGIQGDMFSNEAKQAVERLPKVSGSGPSFEKRKPIGSLSMKTNHPPPLHSLSPALTNVLVQFVKIFCGNTVQDLKYDLMS